MAIILHHEAQSAFDAATQVTQDSASAALELFSSCFQINWFRETGPNLWLAVVKPFAATAEHFGLGHEYFVIGNGYPDDFHQRTLKAEPPIKLVDRLDMTIRFVAANAPRAEAFCAAWAQNNKATAIVIRTESVSQIPPIDLMYKLLSASLWRRDYFAEAEPVRGPSEFFGREVVVNELFTKILLGNPFAIFGLRKVGKSSLLGRLEDLIEQDESAIGVTAFLIGNSTRLKGGRWWDAAADAVAAWQAKLQRLATKLGSKVHAKAERLKDAVQKKESDSRRLAVAFEKDIGSLLKAAKALAKEAGRDDVRLVLILDECDHFYPHLIDSGHWRTDFFVFWNALQGIKRSLESPGEFVYVLGGVNPSGVEQGSLLSQANPLYETQRLYLGPMPALEAYSLLSSLGERMGLLFHESALTRAFELVGGHPLLLRRLGSAIHESSLHRTDRKSVNAQDVEKAFKAKKRDLFNQVAWFLEHLARVSPDEERMLRDIANGGAQAYADLWSNDDFRETYAHHLEQYGLLRFENDLPIIALDLIREALKRPIASEFIEQKKQLKDVIESIEQAVRIRLRVDLERDTAPDDAVAHVVSAIPSDAKNRPLGRKELIELGNIAGVGAVLDAMNWGDYEILFDKFYDRIEWSGSLIDKQTRIGNIKRAFTQAHLIRHNNDHQIKQLIDERGYSEVYASFAAIREILGA